MCSFRGVSLIDVIVGTALVLVVFAGLFGILRASLQIAGVSKLKATATEIAESKMEYIRSLSYDDVGTVAGIPAGLIPQNATTTNGGLEYDVRTYIAYVDDEADGLGALDATGITTDYKVVKVVVSYEVNNSEREVVLISNLSPQGIESTVGGGTLQINVVNAVGTPVSGATVRIQNASTSPTIDLSTFSDTSGVVLLPGAPTSTEYQITVSKTGYSQAQTYERDATNVNPTPGYLTVIEGSTTSGTFAIDMLATLVLQTFSPIEAFSWSDTLDSSLELYSITNVQVASGALTLSGSPGSYAGSGSALSTTTAPARLASWGSASASIIESAGTSVRFVVTDASGTALPDGVVPGNSGGLTGTVDLSALSTTTYPSLRLLADLRSNDVTVTPQLLEWNISYDAGPNPLPDVPIELTGAKTIGSDSGGASLYKTEISTTTDATGNRSLSVEWDSYSISTPGYDIVLSDPIVPYDLVANTVVSAMLILTPSP